MKTVAKAVAFIAFTAILSGSASAQCKRHFYNKSPAYFNIVMTNAGLCNGGPYCTIPPGGTLTLYYIPSPVAYMRIWSSFYAKEFSVTGCHINHSGSTGAIAVNDPAEGDVTTCGARNWPCARYGFRP